MNLYKFLTEGTVKCRYFDNMKSGIEEFSSIRAIRCLIYR